MIYLYNNGVCKMYTGDYLELQCTYDFSKDDREVHFYVDGVEKYKATAVYNSQTGNLSYIKLAGTIYNRVS